MSNGDRPWVRVESLDDLKTKGHLVSSGSGHNIVVFYHGEIVYAIDNRCPHMGFPLSQGSLEDGILTCHWHHARFDLESGGTFDPWADDARTFQVEVRGDEIWVDPSPQIGVVEHQKTRLREGLEQNLRLVIAKAAIALADADVPVEEPFGIAVDFGVQFRRAGWGQGLTILACMQNGLQFLHREDHAEALYQGLSAVADDTDAEAPRFSLRPLPDPIEDQAQLKRWFRRFVEVRDSDGAERCLVSATRSGLTKAQIADMLFSAVTDHRYIRIGHALDFTNKALEALDHLAWSNDERIQWVLGSLANGYATADRMEESNRWRNPIDLVEILERAFPQLEPALQTVEDARDAWTEPAQAEFVQILLGEDPQTIIEASLDALRAGAAPGELAKRISYAAALRIARFPTSNEFSDWDTALHTFTFSSAVHRGLLRAPSAELVRGALDAAMSIYLDRFLNLPPAKLPSLDGVEAADPEALSSEMLRTLDHQQQVDQMAQLTATYLGNGGDPDRLIETLHRALLREDRDFHTIQMIEAASFLHDQLSSREERAHVLIAAARYLGAHAPTRRAQFQTFDIARRLHRGEALFRES